MAAAKGCRGLSRRIEPQRSSLMQPYALVPSDACELCTGCPTFRPSQAHLYHQNHLTAEGAELAVFSVVAAALPGRCRVLRHAAEGDDRSHIRTGCRTRAGLRQEWRAPRPAVELGPSWHTLKKKGTLTSGEKLASSHATAFLGPYRRDGSVAASRYAAGAPVASTVVRVTLPDRVTGRRWSTS